MIAARVASTHSRGPQPANALGSAGTPVSGMTDSTRLVGVELGTVVGVAVAWRLSEDAVDVALGMAVGGAVDWGAAEVAVVVGVRVAGWATGLGAVGVGVRYLRVGVAVGCRRVGVGVTCRTVGRA